MRAAFVLILALVLASQLQAMPAMADGCPTWDVHCHPQSDGDQDQGAIVTTGVKFPGVDENSRLGEATSSNASCSDCHWTVAPSCQGGGAENDELCQNAVIS